MQSKLLPHQQQKVMKLLLRSVNHHKSPDQTWTSSKICSHVVTHSHLHLEFLSQKLIIMFKNGIQQLILTGNRQHTNTLDMGSIS